MKVREQLTQIRRSVASANFRSVPSTAHADAPLNLAELIVVQLREKGIEKTFVDMQEVFEQKFGINLVLDFRRQLSNQIYIFLR